MPTNANAYNSRVTDESLEKRFRDTFRSQGGAELVDDLYAQGVIVPVVDFTQAATGQTLGQNLQTAWDFATNFTRVAGATSSLISTAGFWKVHGSFFGENATGTQNAQIYISDSITTKTIWRFEVEPGASGNTYQFVIPEFVVFLRSGDTLTGATSSDLILNVSARQIATVSGDLVDPSGFTSS